MELTEPKEFYPFVGLSAYKEEDSSIFYGREEEINHLYKRVNENIATVFYGKSGIGKTSLIRAGLMPILQKNKMLAIYIKLNYKNKRSTPIEQIKTKILNKLKHINPNIDDFKNKTLWEFFHELKLSDEIKPVLIFDQFEEIFTLDKKHLGEVNEVILQISNLIENQIPVGVSSRIVKNDLPYDSQKQNYRILISMRESYLSNLEALSSFLPSLKKNKYKLLEINRQSAIECVYKSAEKIITSKNAERIVDMILKESIPDFQKHAKNEELINSFLIEPFILSMVCFEINEFRMSENDDKISDELLEKVEINKIIKDFYETSTSDLPKSTRKVIENVLLTFDGYRKLENKTELTSKEDLSDEELNRLVNRRIIRSEIWNGSEHIEIIHDILVPIITQIRDIRVEEERKEKREEELREIRRQEEQKRLAQKRKMQQEAENQKLKHRQRFKFIAIVTAISAFAAIVLAILWLYAMEQSDIASLKAKEASANYIAADGLLIAESNPTKGFVLARAAFELSPTSKMSIRAIIKCFYEGNFYSNIIETEAVSLSSHASFKSNKVYLAKDDSVLIFEKEKFIRKFKVEEQIIWFEVSNNEEFILVANGKKARLYTTDGKLLDVIEGHKKDIKYVRFSPDNQYFATASKDNTAIVRNIKDKTSFTIKLGRDITTIDFSPNGKIIIAGSKNRKLSFWDYSGKLLQETELEGAVEMAKFTPDGKKIIAVTDVPSISIYSAEGLKLFTKNLNSKINYFSFDSQGKFIICAENNGIASLWDTSLYRIKEFKGHDAPLNTADFSENMDFIITSSLDNTVKKWKLGSFSPYTVVKTDDPIFFVEVSSKKQMLLSTIQDTVFLWDKNGKLLKKFSHGSRIYSAKFSNSEKNILTTGKDNLAKIWDLNGNLKVKLKGHENIIYTARYTSDDRNIITASRDGKAILWNANGKKIKEFKNQTLQPVLDASISNDKKHVAVCTEDENIEIWNIETDSSFRFVGHKGGIISIDFSPDGTKILTSGVDRTAKIWDLKGNVLKTFKGHQGRLYSAEFSPDGNNLVTTSADGTVKYWNINGEELFTFRLHNDVVSAAVFSPDGKYVISSANDNTIKKWPITVSEIFKFIDEYKIYGNIWKLDKETKEKYELF